MKKIKRVAFIIAVKIFPVNLLPRTRNSAITVPPLIVISLKPWYTNPGEKSPESGAYLVSNPFTYLPNLDLD